MEYIHQILNQSPELALFLSLAIGYWIGSIQFGKFQLGGVAGSLLAAVVISQVGVTIDNGIKSVLFALFIYARWFRERTAVFSVVGAPVASGDRTGGGHGTQWARRRKTS